MRIEKFKARDLEWLMEQPRHEHLKKHVRLESLPVLEKAPHAYTVFSDDGKVMACGGLADYWENRAEVWAVLNENVRPHFVALHGFAKRLLEYAPFRRIEAAVEKECQFGHRWVKALGFELEAPLLKRYLPNGNDCSLYARVY